MCKKILVHEIAGWQRKILGCRDVLRKMVATTLRYNKHKLTVLQHYANHKTTHCQSWKSWKSVNWDTWIRWDSGQGIKEPPVGRRIRSSRHSRHKEIYQQDQIESTILNNSILDYTKNCRHLNRLYWLNSIFRCWSQLLCASLSLQYGDNFSFSKWYGRVLKYCGIQEISARWKRSFHQKSGGQNDLNRMHLSWWNPVNTEDLPGHKSTILLLRQSECRQSFF